MNTFYITLYTLALAQYLDNVLEDTPVRFY